jgi:hypothetical protein
MQIVVKIDSEDSVLVERKYFEHMAGKDTVAFLMKDKDIKWDTLQHYINVVESRFTELELTKEAITKKYLPKDFEDATYTYSFDFNNESIIYNIE